MEQCHDRAAVKRYTVFGLEVGEECWTAANALETYQKHGTATGCNDREGGPWSLDVYRIIPCPSKTICCLKKEIDFSIILLLHVGWGGELSVSLDFSTLFNIVVYSGVFPGVLKIVEVICLYKSGD